MPEAPYSEAKKNQKSTPKNHKALRKRLRFLNENAVLQRVLRKKVLQLVLGGRF